MDVEGLPGVVVEEKREPKAVEPPQTPASTSLTLTIDRFTMLLVAIAVTLVAISLLSRFAGTGLGRLDVDIENSVPTLWASLQLALLTVVCGLVALADRTAGLPARGWIAVTACVGFIFLDESLVIHEELIEPLRERFETDGLLTFAWIVPYLGLVVVVACLLLPWFRRLPTVTQKRLVIAVAIFLTGAVGAEATGGLIVDEGVESNAFAAITSLEELLEKIGVALAVRGVLYELRSRVPAGISFD